MPIYSSEISAGKTKQNCGLINKNKKLQKKYEDTWTHLLKCQTLWVSKMGMISFSQYFTFQHVIYMIVSAGVESGLWDSLMVAGSLHKPKN